MSTSRADKSGSGNLEREEADDELASAFAKRILSLKHEHEGMGAFAKRLNVSRSQLQNWKKETAPDPKLSTLLHIESVTGARLAWLAKGEGPTRPEDKRQSMDYIFADVAVTVKWVEEAVQGFGWECPPDEKMSMVMGVLTEMQRRRHIGEHPHDMAAAMTIMREVHRAHQARNQKE